MTGIHDALAAAKARAQQQIEWDGRNAPAAVRRQLETLCERLFDPAFDLAEIVAEPAAQRQFRFTFGVSPKGYRDRFILDAARHLVCETRLPVTEVAAGLGFAEPEAFSRWFKYRTGLSPMKLRDEHRRGAEKRPVKAPEPPPEDHDLPLSPAEFRRVLLGAASPRTARALLRHLYESYPEALAGKRPPME